MVDTRTKSSSTLSNMPLPDAPSSLLSTMVFNKGLLVGLSSGDGNFPWGSITIGSSGEEMGMDEVTGEIDMGPSGESEVLLDVLAGTGKGDVEEVDCTFVLRKGWLKKSSNPILSF